MDAEQINAELTRLHGGPEAARLSELHIMACQLKNDAGWRRFHLTHAWVYALVAGHDETELAAELQALGGL